MEITENYKANVLAKRLLKDYIKKYIPVLIFSSILLIICAGALAAQPILLQITFDRYLKKKILITCYSYL